MTDHPDIVDRLNNTPNWMRESYGSWKDCVLTYDRAPFEAAAEITRLRAEAEALRSVMIAAAEEIQAHWPAHCDAEGYGPANLMRRLEEGIPSQYAYTAGDFVRLMDEAEALRKDAERWRFTNDNWFQLYEPTQHWKVTTATGKVLHEGTAKTYEAAADAAIAATKEQQA